MVKYTELMVVEYVDNIRLNFLLKCKYARSVVV